MNVILPLRFAVLPLAAAVFLPFGFSGCASTEAQGASTRIAMNGASTGISVKVESKAKGGKPLAPEESFMKSALLGQKIMRETAKPGLTQEQMTENVIQLIHRERAAGRLSKTDRVTIQPVNGKPIVVD